MNNSKAGIFVFLLLVFFTASEVSIAQEAATQDGKTETKLKAIPDEWPDTVPRPEKLTDIGGWLNTRKDANSKQKKYTVDMWGKSTISGLEYFKHYSKLLEKSGFKKTEYKHEFNMIRARFERGDQWLTFGSNIVNARTPKEYVEIAFTLRFKK